MWAIQPEYAFASAHLISKLFNGESVFEQKNETDNEDQLTIGCFAVTREGAIAFGSKYNPFENAQPGSTAVLSISGPIMKYDNCGDMGTKSYAALLKKAEANHNINSVILMIDSPGGTVDGTFDLGAVVDKFSKPVVAFVDGLMASAAYRIGSGAAEIIANNETCDIGSIGTMLNFMDVQPAYEKMGVKFHHVYADASKDKNQDFHQLQQGNYDLVKKDLNTINNLFISDVKRNRPNIKETALTGKMFLAKEALEQGLIDAIGNFDYAIERAQDLAYTKSKKTTPSSNQNLQNQNMNKVTLTAKHAAIIALCGISLNADQNSVDVELTTELLDKINASLEANTAALNTANKNFESASEQITCLTNELNELKKANPGATKVVTTTTDVLEVSEEVQLTETQIRMEAVYDKMYGEGAYKKALAEQK